jgi:hypothetical protein
VHAQRQRLALVCKAIVHAPVLAARIHQPVHAAAVCVLVASHRADVFDVLGESVSQRHKAPLGGVSAGFIFRYCQ